MSPAAHVVPRLLRTAELRGLIFVARCSGAATMAYELAAYLGMAQASWAAVSAVVVSQDELHETQSSLAGRISGTLVGIAVTIAVRRLAAFIAVPVEAQMAMAIAVCAVIARRFPQLRVAMWTCPTLLLASQPAVPLATLALHRGSEVILGAVVGLGFHWLAELIVGGTPIKAIFQSLVTGDAYRALSSPIRP